jgi:hypothetical protein
MSPVGHKAEIPVAMTNFRFWEDSGHVKEAGQCLHLSRALGLTVPSALLATADEAIE